MSLTLKTELAHSDFSLDNLELIVKFIAAGRVTVAQEETFTPVEQKPSIWEIRDKHDFSIVLCRSFFADEFKKCQAMVRKLYEVRLTFSVGGQILG